MLESVNALPITDIITFENDGTLKVGNKNLTAEQAISLRESLVSLNNNWSRRLINEQITFEAIKLGVHIGQSTDQIMFSKAAIWILAKENELIAKLIGQTTENNL